MNWPNRLTVIRIVLVPVIVAFLLIDSIPYRFLFAAVIFAVASVTDHVDGHLARKYNQITNFGKLADPLADKILVISMLVCFVQLKTITALPVIIIIAREFLVTSIRLAAMGKGNVISANQWGKLKTVSQILSISVTLFVLCLGKTELNMWSEVFVWISVFFTVISGMVYVKDNIYVIKDEV